MSESAHSEESRLAALMQLEVLDTLPSADFDALVKIAASVCGVPISLITLVDKERQWFKANLGLEGVEETPRDMAFCAHAIEDDGIFEINDASTDRRFNNNPLVIGEPNIRFYAGATLRLSNGAHVGTLCVIDREPRQLTEPQRQVLQNLSAVAVQAMESHRAARHLAINEAQFRALSDSSPLGVFRTDADGACTYTNPRWQRIFDLNPTEALGHGWSQTLHPDDKASVFAQWTRAAVSQSEFDMEFRILHNNGETVSVRAISRPVVTQDGIISGHIGSVENVSERVKAQQALYQEGRRLEFILEGTKAGTWEWNVQTGDMRFNDRWANLLGTTLEAMHPISEKTWKERMHPDDVPSHETRLEQHLIREIDVYDCELRLRHEQGHWVWVHLTGRVLTYSADGKPEWMFGTQLDITSRKEQEQALRKSEWLLAETGALADVGGWELDLLTGKIQCTAQACRIHGLPPGHPPSLEAAMMCYAPEARPVFQDAMDRAINEGRNWDLELPLNHTDRGAAWVRAVGHVEYADNKPVRLVGAFQNITDRVLQRQALENAHARINMATESGNIGVWDLDIASGKLSWNSQMYALYGLDDDSDITNIKQWAMHIHPDDRTSTVQTISEVANAGSGGFDMEFRALRPDDSVHYIRASANVTRDVDGLPVRIFGVNWDVTPLRTLSNELAEQHELLQVTLQSIGDAVITTDLHGLVTWLNPVAEQMTGWSIGNAQGLPINRVFNIVHEQTRRPVENPVEICLKHGDIVGLASKTVLISCSRAEFAIEDSAAPIRSKNGDLLGVVLVFHDVTEQRRLANEMSYRAEHDSLTGLLNRSAFESCVQRALDKTTELACESALMYIDLDQFKLVNDACGHAQGDQLLIQISKLLQQIVHEGDTLARLGGDEFGVILEDCTRDRALRVAQQLCDSMDEFRFEHEKRRFRVGASVGLVSLDERWKDIESAMQAADTSCLAAKEAGRNRVHEWFDTDKAMHTRLRDMQWATRLEQALDEDKFVLYAQRIDNRSGGSDRIHAEVLIRLQDDDGSLIHPNSFLPAAERFDLATRVDRWILQHTLAVLVQLPDIKTIDMLCINLSGQSVGDREFHSDAIQLLEDAGQEICQRICLEITETAAITNIADATTFIKQLRALGVRIALDDFGSGASSFGYLKSLKVDVLKIDGQFITGVIDDPLDGAAVRCFVDIARVMQLKTVAECVESQSVLDCLDAIGVDYAQGYFLHKPENIEKLLNCPEAHLEMA